MVQPSGTSSPDVGPIEAPRAQDPAPPPATPRQRTSWRKWRARFIVLVLLAAAVLLFLRISSTRSEQSHRVALDKVVLTAQAIPVEPVRAGQVTGVAVTANQTVTAGQRLGTMDVSTTKANGDPKIIHVNLTAPRGGIVIADPAPVGSTVQPGAPFLKLYDPTQMTFVTDVDVENLSVVAPSMTAVLHTDGSDHTVHAVVQRVVPEVAGAQVTTTLGVQPSADTDTDTLQVVLAPAGPADLRGLVPGLRFTGYIDTVSGKPGSSRLVSLPRPHASPRR